MFANLMKRPNHLQDRVILNIDGAIECTHSIGLDKARPCTRNFS